MCLLSKGEPYTVVWVSVLPWQQNLTAGLRSITIRLLLILEVGQCDFYK